MPTPLEFLESTLNGVVPTEADVRSLLSQSEDIHHDFKSGQSFRGGDAPTILRQWITSFGNSAGGSLLFGVTNSRPHIIDGCPATVGNAALHEWAAHTLATLAPHFSPQPRIHEVATSDGPVLIVAIARQPQLVPLVTAGNLSYYLRIGETTHRAPDYLIADLLLGRRTTAIVDLAIDPACPRLRTSSGQAPCLEFEVTATNLSFVKANDAAVGVIGFMANPPSATKITSNILPYLDIIDAGGYEAHLNPLHLRLSSRKSVRIEIPPLDVAEFGTNALDLIVPQYGGVYQFALYFIAEGNGPRWYQVELTLFGSKTPTYHAGRRLKVTCSKCPLGAAPRIAFKPSAAS